MNTWKKKSILASIVFGASVLLISTVGLSADRPKILVVYPYLGDQSFVRMHAASVAEAAKFPEVKIDIVAGPDRTNVEYFISSINKAVTEHYNVLVLNHGGAAAQLYPALRKAQDQGIKVVAFDTGLPELAGHSAAMFSTTIMPPQRSPVRSSPRFCRRAEKSGFCVACWEIRTLMRL
jgi:ribose transport system substrate-binding protein